MRSWILDAHEYQHDTVQRIIRQPRVGLFADPGLGKTAMALKAYRELQGIDANGMLVIAPLRPAHSVWPKEPKQWDDFEGLKVHVLHGKGRTESALNNGADVYVINPEGLPWLVGGTFGEKKPRTYPPLWQNWKGRPDMLVVDESTKFKRYTGGRARLLQKMLPGFNRRMPMTGTPAPNGLEDLHGQLKLIDDGDALGRTLEDFRCEYFVPVRVEHGYEWRPKKDTQERIYKQIAPLVVRLDARDHLDLPDLVEVDRPVPMPDGIRGLYQQLRQEMVIELEKGDVVATNAGALTAKCRQLASGVVYLHEDGEVARAEQRKTQIVHKAKVDALVELVEELSGKPLMVATEFRHEVAMIQNVLRTKLKIDAPYLGAGVSPKRGVQIEDAWNERRLRVLLVNGQAAAHGLNIQFGGHHLCWYTPTWDLEIYIQLTARLWRQGQESDRVVLHHLMMENTVDEKVVRARRRKGVTQQDLLDSLKQDLVTSTT